jgi:hypothetical protein
MRKLTGHSEAELAAENRLRTQGGRERRNGPRARRLSTRRREGRLPRDSARERTPKRTPASAARSARSEPRRKGQLPVGTSATARSLRAWTQRTCRSQQAPPGREAPWPGEGRGGPRCIERLIAADVCDCRSRLSVDLEGDFVHGHRLLFVATVSIRRMAPCRSPVDEDERTESFHFQTFG